MFEYGRVYCNIYVRRNYVLNFVSFERKFGTMMAANVELDRKIFHWNIFLFVASLYIFVISYSPIVT